LLLESGSCKLSLLVVDLLAFRIESGVRSHHLGCGTERRSRQQHCNGINDEKRADAFAISRVERLSLQKFQWLLQFYGTDDLSSAARRLSVVLHNGGLRTLEAWYQVDRVDWGLNPIIQDAFHLLRTETTTLKVRSGPKKMS
jgi:hypothetical protein